MNLKLATDERQEQKIAGVSSRSRLGVQIFSSAGRVSALQGGKAQGFLSLPVDHANDDDVRGHRRV